MTMEIFVAVVAVLGFVGAICLAMVSFWISDQEEKEAGRHSVKRYDDNEEYDYGHNVHHHYLDGEGDI